MNILAQVSCWTHIYSNQKWDLQTILAARFHISWECMITKHESFASLTYMFHQSFTHIADRITITDSRHACLIWSAGLQEDTFCQQNLDFSGGFNQMLVAAINVLCKRLTQYRPLFYIIHKSTIYHKTEWGQDYGIIKCKTMMTNSQHVKKKKQRKRKLIFTLLLTEKLPNSSLILQQLYHYTRMYSSHTAATEAEKSAQCFSHI